MTWACDQRLAYMKDRIDEGHPVNRMEVARRFNCTKQTVAADWRRFEQRFPGVAAYCGRQKAYMRADLAGKQDWRSRALAAEAQVSAMSPAAATMQAIDQLRADEGHSVSIHSDNPDFNGLPNCAIDVTAAWTNWQPLTFRSDTVLDCLRAALQASQSEA